MANPTQTTFVIGVPRSGTTLLRVLLDSHSQIAAGPESGWITGDYTETSLRTLTEMLGDGELGLVQNFPGTSEKQVMRATAKLLKDLFKPYLSARGKPLLVLKTPNDIAHLGFLRKLMPEARYIHIVRDGRDVALSTVAKKGTFFSDSTLGYEFGDLTFINALQRWMVWEQRATKILNRIPKRVHHLSYEALVAQPEPELRDICEFLGQEFEPAMLEFAKQSHEYPSWEAGSSDVKNTQEVNVTSVARWKRELSPLHAASIPASINDYLMERGYEDTFAEYDPALISVAQSERTADAESELQERINSISNELQSEKEAHDSTRREQLGSADIERLFDGHFGRNREELDLTIRELLDPQIEQDKLLSASISHLEAELSNAQQALNGLLQERADSAAQERQKYTEQLAQQASEQRTQLQQISSEITTLRTELTAALTQASTLQNELLKQEQQAANQLRHTESELHEAKTEIASLRGDFGRAQQALEERAAQVTATEQALEQARSAKDLAIRQLAQDRKKKDSLTAAVSQLKQESSQLKDHSAQLDAENGRLKSRMTQIASSTQSLQRIISKQEQEAWEKEQVIQGMLGSRTWKTGRLALGPLALLRNTLSRSSVEAEQGPQEALTSAQLRAQAELEAKQAREAFEAEEAAKAHSAAQARAADSVLQSQLAGEASAARAVAEATQTEEAHQMREARAQQQAAAHHSVQEQSALHHFREAQSASQAKAARDAASDSGAKINLGGQVEEYFGAHRSGWAFAVQHLGELHDPKAIYLDTFMERTFCWEGGRGATLEPWVGIIHVPPGGPDWFLNEQSNEALFASDYWKASEPFCQGLFCLSNYHRRALRKHVDLPIETLIHPTETPDVLWDPVRYSAQKRPKVVQLGWWLRVLHAIYELPEGNYEKVFLRPRNDQAFLDALATEQSVHLEQGLFDPAMSKSVRELEFLANDEYDQLLSESVVFMQLYDASANNAVIECIVRNTPLLINPLDPVVEYLGSGYPLYFSTLEEASEKLHNPALVLHAHEYLKNHPIKEKLTGEYFMHSLKTSKLLRSATP